MAKPPVTAPAVPPHTIRHVDGVMHLTLHPDRSRPTPPPTNVRHEHGR